MKDRISLFLSLNSSMKAEREELEKRKERKILSIVKLAYENTDFYRNWFNQNRITPGDIRTISDLKLIPPVKREHIQNRFESFISQKISRRDCYLRTTSGSSGKVIKVAWDKKNYWTRIVLCYRAFQIIGYTPIKKIAYFLPVTEDTGWNFGLFRNLPISTGTPLNDAAEMIASYKPHILSIYPSLALDLAEHFSDLKNDLKNIEAISLNSEMVYPHDEKRIKELYNCETYHEYSSVETGMIASMCKMKKMHIFTDNIHLEILDDENRPLPAGETGNVVITTLNNFAMPLIRYNIGDLASIETGKCECGLPYPLLGKIQGRKDDSLYLKNGKTMSPWQIYEIIERPLEKHGAEKIAINDFYLIQEERDEASLYYTRGPQFQESFIKDIQNKWNLKIGNECRLKIIEQDRIKKNKNSKRKYIHSLV